MTATVEQINRQARAIHPLRALLTCVAGVLFALGWVTCKVVGTLWFVTVWMFVATREGWRSAKLSHEPGRQG